LKRDKITPGNVAEALSGIADIYEELATSLEQNPQDTDLMKTILTNVRKIL
jgi:hypothetical protein